MIVTFTTNSRTSSINSLDTALIRRVIKTRIEAARRAKINLMIRVYDTIDTNPLADDEMEGGFVGMWTPSDGWREEWHNSMRDLAEMCDMAWANARRSTAARHRAAGVEACDKATTSAERTAIQQQYEDGCITLGQRNEALAAL